MAVQTLAATYVYGVLSAGEPPPAATGIGGAPLREVTSDGIAALVSDLGEKQLALGREEMTTHAHVLDAALARGTVLPMRFGVVMAGEPSVKSHLLEAHHDELERQLRELNGKVEVRLRAVYQEDSLMREVVREDLDVARLRRSLRGASEEATYYGRIRLGELVAAAIERKREVDATAILDLLAPLGLDTRIAEVSYERIVVNVSFLVDTDQLPEFDRAVDDLGAAQQHRMRFKYTGPLPPHSFVELRTEA
jgi:hypothetical protein